MALAAASGSCSLNECRCSCGVGSSRQQQLCIWCFTQQQAGARQYCMQALQPQSCSTRYVYDCERQTCVCVDCVNMCVITSMLLTTNVFVIWTRTVYIDLSTLACKQLASLIVFEVGSMLQSQGACTQVFKGIWWHRVWLIVSRFELCLVLVAVLLPSNHMCVRVQRACI